MGPLEHDALQPVGILKFVMFCPKLTIHSWNTSYNINPRHHRKLGKAPKISWGMVSLSNPCQFFGAWTQWGPCSLSVQTGLLHEKENVSKTGLIGHCWLFRFALSLLAAKADCAAFSTLSSLCNLGFWSTIYLCNQPGVQVPLCDEKHQNITRQHRCIRMTTALSLFPRSHLIFQIVTSEGYSNHVAQEITQESSADFSTHRQNSPCPSHTTCVPARAR